MTTTRLPRASPWPATSAAPSLAPNPGRLASSAGCASSHRQAAATSVSSGRDTPRNALRSRASCGRTRGQDHRRTGRAVGRARREHPGTGRVRRSGRQPRQRRSPRAWNHPLRRRPRPGPFARPIAGRVARSARRPRSGPRSSAVRPPAAPGDDRATPPVPVRSPIRPRGPTSSGGEKLWTNQHNPLPFFFFKKIFFNQSSRRLPFQ